MKRRDILASILGAPLLSSLGALGGCGEEPLVPEVEGRLIGQSLESGHLLAGDNRAQLAQLFAGEIEERHTKVAIIGGGPAGLSAAWRLSKAGITDFTIYELEEKIGGTSSFSESDLTPYPWGAHYLPLPSKDQPRLIELLEEMQALDGRDEAGHPRGQEHLLVRVPDERLFYRGFWLRGLYPQLESGAEDAVQRARFEQLVQRWVRAQGPDGRRAMRVPSSACSEGPEGLALDGISAADWCDRNGLTSPHLRWWLEYGTRDDYGLRLEDASAWSLLFYHAARVRTGESESADFLTWPEGNGALVRHLSAGQERRIRTHHMAVQIRQNEDHALVDLLRLPDRRPLRIRAEQVIVALPRFISSRVVEGRESAEDASYGAWMVANLHLRSRPGERGAPPAWDNVIYDSPSLGYVAATHQQGRDFGPTIWTYYFPLTDSDPRAGRRRLMQHDWSHWKEAIVADLSRAHPDLPRHLSKIDVWRWGHAMAQPRVGSHASPARRRAAEAQGRLHFAHSDLSGLALFEESFAHGNRAADEVLQALGGRS